VTEIEWAVHAGALLVFELGLACAIYSAADEVGNWLQQRRIARAEAWCAAHPGERWPPMARPCPPMPPPPPPPPRWSIDEWRAYLAGRRTATITMRRDLAGTYCASPRCRVAAAAIFNAEPYCAEHLVSEVRWWIQPPPPPRAPKDRDPGA